ncbi:hypothetical protein QYM36_016684 [Artemia franciscana]|uniref:Uncharacterized protein n=1 Tax=Artemia franciscana TaxID=6661 RepID=A0AA88HF25_ARTSF|nr:hypothetical protein QYM36_016684 [Artemia franciscana]
MVLPRADSLEAIDMLGLKTDYESSSYSESHGSSYGCCTTVDDILPLVALIGLALFTFYLIIITSTTTAAARKRQLSDKGYFRIENNIDAVAYLISHGFDRSSRWAMIYHNDGIDDVICPAITLGSSARMGEGVTGKESERAIGRYGYMYDNAASASGYGGGGGCCGGKNDLLPLLALAALSLLLIYLITAALTTTAAARRKRDVSDNDTQWVFPDEVTLDGPAWLSMIHELWQQDAVADNPYCAYETLCRMNRIAAESGGQGTWAAHLSSVPLSYLLHNRHEYGFQGYMNAALMGKAGANCTELYSGCSRLN